MQFFLATEGEVPFKRIPMKSQSQGILWEMSLQPSTFTLIFQSLLHKFQSNIVYYMSHVLMDILCAYGVTWIKTEGTFH